MGYRRLPLTGMSNARELGGWNTPNGVTRYGVFLRSEVPSQLTEADIAFLRDYGLTMDVDLRGASELRDLPDLLREESWVEYVHLPMFDEAAARGSGQERKLDRATFSWGERYVLMCEDSKEWVRQVIEALGRSTGAALYHCAAGKDRTGIITALLLGICGVADEDIAADYSVSQLYLGWLYDRIQQRMPEGKRPDADDPFFSTAASNMQTLLTHWHTKYGGVRGYLRTCGVSDELMDKIADRLVEPNL